MDGTGNGGIISAIISLNAIEIARVGKKSKEKSR
jgi:hypothetical protein